MNAAFFHLQVFSAFLLFQVGLSLTQPIADTQNSQEASGRVLKEPRYMFLAEGNHKANNPGRENGEIHLSTSAGQLTEPAQSRLRRIYYSLIPQKKHQRSRRSTSLRKYITPHNLTPIN